MGADGSGGWARTVGLACAVLLLGLGRGCAERVGRDRDDGVREPGGAAERAARAEGSVLLHALFRDARGLDTSSPVRVGPRAVGRVVGRSWDPATGRSRVTFTVDAEVPIYDNALVFLRREAGLVALDIDPGGAVRGQGPAPALPFRLFSGEAIDRVVELVR